MSRAGGQVKPPAGGMLGSAEHSAQEVFSTAAAGLLLMKSVIKSKIGV
jgi:hypothetical protein